MAASLLLLSSLGCNRKPREVTLDLTLREISQAGTSAVVAEPPELYVPEGAQVRILVRNATQQAHNFVLVQPGHIDDVLATTPNAKADAKADSKNDTKAEAPDAQVLTRGPWVAPQSTQATRFPAPLAGHYEFTCACGTASHPRPLRGKLIVQ